MADTLHDRLRRLRWRIRLVLAVYGLSWVLAILLGGVLLAGMLDWLLHLDDPGLRLTLGLGVVAATVFVGWQSLLAPLLQRLGDVELALRIERRFPGFQDALASTVQFLEHRLDPHVGSPDLQRHVVERAVAEVEQIDVSDVVEVRGMRRALAAALAVGLLCGFVAAVNWSSSRIALARLLFPFEANPWPRTTELRLVDSHLQPLGDKLQLARGGTLELFVLNQKGQLPRDLAMEYRVDEDSVTRERPRRANLPGDNGQTREVAVVRVAASQGEIAFRAVGGDDREMRWHRLDVVPPPSVEDLRISLTPPAYSGRSIEKLPPGVGHVHGLVGTHVAIAATVNKPLGSAHLRIADQPPLAIALSPDGLHFEATFEIAQPGVYSYWFDLRDRQGFQDPEAPRYEIRGIADLVPEVTIERPETDMQVTADAVVPLRVSAKDDLALADLWLRFKRHESEETAAGIPLTDGTRRSAQQLTVEQDWPLEPLALQPGMRLAFYAEAADEFDLTDAPHVGRSIARVLTVVSPEAKRAEIASRQGELIDELDAVREAQDQAHARVAELRTQMQAAGQLRPEDLDLLKRVELEQRQIASRLTNPADGVESRARGLQEEFRNNRLEDVELQRRLGQIGSELGALREEQLPAVERELTQARKESQASAGDDSQAPEREAGAQESLASAERDQKAVLESLGRLLDQLSQWRDERQLGADLAEMIARQAEVNRESSEAGRETLTRSLSQLAPQERADLARLAERQKRLAENLEEFSSELDQLRQEIEDRSPATADALSQAADQLSRKATAGRMREAAGQLEQNRIGQATTTQEQMLQELKDLEQTLQNRGVPDAEALVQKLKQTESELETLRKREDELLQKMESAADLAEQQEREESLDLLRKQQQEVQDELARLEREMRRVQADRAADAAERAASAMDRIAENLARNPDDPLTLKKEQEQLRRDVDDHLEQAQRELARQRREAEERLARELLERIADELAALLPRQQNVIGETQRLEGERAARGNWTRAQLKSLRDLVQEQRSLQAEAARLVETIKAAEVFAAALEGAARSMQRAADRLQERQTDARTLAAEEMARQRLSDLVEVLNEEPPSGPQGSTPSGSGNEDENEPQKSGPQADAIPQLAQLKLLRLMQVELLARTADLDGRRQNGALLPEDQSELDAIASEQARLADMVRNLMEQVAPPSAAEPAEEPQ